MAWEEKQTKKIEQGLTRVVAVVVVVRALTIKTPEKKTKMRQQLTLITINIERGKKKKNIKGKGCKNKCREPFSIPSLSVIFFLSS